MLTSKTGEDLYDGVLRRPNIGWIIDVGFYIDLRLHSEKIHSVLKTSYSEGESPLTISVNQISDLKV